MDDRRVGLVLRALRRRRGWRQLDLAAAADVSQVVVSRCERGHLASLPALRRMVAALDARLELDVRWRAGELDRLLDARHALLVEAVAVLLAANRWQTFTEVTYSIYGERGSIDLLGARPDIRAVVVSEIKSEITSWEETQRTFDAKCRLLPTIVAERLGWRPAVVARLLIVEETMTNRRRLAKVERAATAAYPARGHEIRRWLRQPDGTLAGIWFLSPSRARIGSETRGGFHRVRAPRRPVRDGR